MRLRIGFAGIFTVFCDCFGEADLFSKYPGLCPGELQRGVITSSPEYIKFQRFHYCCGYLENDLSRMMDSLTGDIEQSVADCGEVGCHGIDKSPELNKILSNHNPPVIQRLSDANRAYWSTASANERRMTALIGYLQHPNP